jgi:hypothetical protein
MSAFYMNEASFDLPDASFVDRTVTYLEGKAPSGAAVVLMVERSPLPEGKSLRQAASAHMSDGKKRLRGYSLLFDRVSEIAGAPAIELAARWRDDAGLVYSRQAHLVLGPTMLIIAGESPIEEQEFCDACVAHILATLRPIE